MDAHFNQLTPAEAERLALLLEELGEAQQAIGKILRHGYESTHPSGGVENRTSLTKELADVFVATRLMFDAGDLSRSRVAAYEEMKTESVQKYLHHQQRNPA